ncbi:hypothetical protein Tco_0942517, partial [Tanacetum coccineum]
TDVLHLQEHSQKRASYPDKESEEYKKKLKNQSRGKKARKVKPQSE